jgi:hypothetical protein
MDERLVRIIVLSVTGMWIVSMIAELFISDYDPPASVHVAMMAVVGAATGRYIVMRNGRPKGLDE